MRFSEHYYNESEQIDEAPAGDFWWQKPIGDGKISKSIGLGIKNLVKSLGLGKKTETVDIKNMPFKSFVSANIYGKLIQELASGLKNKDKKNEKYYIKDVYIGKSSFPKDDSGKVYIEDNNKKEIIDKPEDLSIYKTNHGGNIVVFSFLNDANKIIYMLSTDNKGNDWFRYTTGQTFSTFIAVGKSDETPKSDLERSMEDISKVEVGDLVRFKEEGAHKALNIIIKEISKKPKDQKDKLNKKLYQFKGYEEGEDLTKAKLKTYLGEFFVRILNKSNKENNELDKEPEKETKQKRVDTGKINGRLVLPKESFYDNMIEEFDAYIKSDINQDIEFQREKKDTLDKSGKKTSWEGIKYTTDVGDVYVSHNWKDATENPPIIIFSNETILYKFLDDGALDQLMRDMNINEDTLLKRIRWGKV